MMDTLWISGSLSLVAYLATWQLIPRIGPVLVQRGRFGKDLLKADRPLIPESTGAIAGLVFFITTFIFLPLPFLDWVLQGHYVDGQSPPFPHALFSQFIGGLLSLLAMLFLGFADDVLDIKWRVKIWMPLFASMPLLMVYFVTYGRTDVLVPLPLRFLFPSKIIPLGFLYYVYMACLCMFSTNAINILAGLNGVEGGQSLVIALSIALNDVCQLYLNPAKKDAHLNSLYFLLPFIGVTVGYLRHNWYPAKAFGGDTYCYFAGMTFAVVGILGNFSKTVLLFMIPQIFNFLYSCPQLFHVVECPRHRMPKFDPKTGLIEASTFTLDPSKTSKLGQLLIQILHFFRLVKIQTDPKSGISQVSNLTLISLILIKTGPTTEERTAVNVLLVQCFCTLIAFLVRYGLVHIVYNADA